MLRTNIDFAQVDYPLRTLLVTSANPSEGKTTTISNLAVVIAHTGKRVIIVDADLRRPALHKVFGLPNAIGLTNMIVRENGQFVDLLQEAGQPGVRILASGPLPPNPSELLGSARMEQVIEQLRAEADVILFDSPPILAVADAAVLGSRLDGVVLVTDAGHTRFEALARAKAAMSRGTSHLLGVVINKISQSSGGYYYYGNTSRPLGRGPGSLTLDMAGELWSRARYDTRGVGAAARSGAH